MTLTPPAKADTFLGREMKTSRTESGSTASPKSEGQKKSEEAPRWRPDQPPACEWDEGYPTDEWLEALHAHVMDFHAAARFLVEGFPAACAGISCCDVKIEEIADSEDRDAGKEITFWTGGWSGAEALIGTMLGQYSIRHFHQRWEAGGLYVFFVRNTLLPEELRARSPSAASASALPPDEPLLPPTPVSSDWEKASVAKSTDTPTFGAATEAQRSAGFEVHVLKTHPEPFAAVRARKKWLEIRRSDRDFKEGDTLWLEEYDPAADCKSGEAEVRIVTHVLPGGQYGIEPGFCAISMTDVPGRALTPNSPPPSTVAGSKGGGGA